MTEFESINISEFVNDIYKGFVHVCTHKKIDFQLTNNIPENTIVNADSQQLRQVFHNILSNCVRHVPHNGNISLISDYDIETGNVLISIADNGPGISDTHKRAVFEKFSTNAKGKQSGVGLGLYICRRILESHHGKIWVEDNDPQGARFIFRFC